MCGIAGIFHTDGTGSPTRDILERMARAIAHRGPDAQAIEVRGPVGLAHRRLSVIDLEGGAQPMASADGRVWIVFNGEIYNFLELREALAREGATFRTRSDTEVILHLYQRHGTACLERLRGMFALAIWDETQGRLFLARDRVGKKPLYFTRVGPLFAFASEIKALLEVPGVTREPDLTAIHHYLTFQYVPSPMTAFRGIESLTEAQAMTVDRGGKTNTCRYWRLAYGPKRFGQEGEAIEAIRASLAEAVKLRLIADVPLGAFLSGGVDSSAVVAAMAAASDRPVKTFSIGFEEEEYDERRFAAMIARRFGTDHQELVVRPRALEILPKLVWHYDQPYADSSAIPTWYLAQMTRRHVTVALNGDAGDENFAGYHRYLFLLSGPDRFVPDWVREHLLRPLTRRLPAGPRRRSFLSRLRRWLSRLGEAHPRRYGAYICHFSNDEKEELLTADFKRRVAGIDSLSLIEEAFLAAGTDDILDAILSVDVQTYLPDDLLVKVDVATMAHGLEGRSPMLDHKFMEMAAAIPASMKMRGLQKKYIFRKALRGVIPDECLDRPKMGFGAPIDVWFRNELSGLTRRVLLSPRARERGYFNPAFVEHLIDAHVSGRGSFHYQLWNLLMLELWHLTFIDQVAVDFTG